MKKILLLLPITLLNGCIALDIIAVPVKAGGAVLSTAGDIISYNTSDKNEYKKINESKIAYTNVQPTLEQQKAIDEMLGI